jgi:adenylyltransferase/sulfurtransferase
MARTALVEPGPALTSRQVERYRRNIDVVGVGDVGQSRLLNARVLVVGAGGLGSPVITYLAAAGVGRLVVADGDVVETSNLQRQVMHSGDEVGVNKAVSAAARVRALNPDVTVRVVPRMLTASSLAGLLAEVDLVLDCCDSFGAKFMISDAAAAAGTPLVWGAAVGMQGQVSVFGVADGEGRTLWLRDLFPAEPAVGTYPLATQIGVLGAMVGQVGSAMATETIKLLAGLGDPLVGRLLILDAAAGRWDVIPVRPRA